jgi:succinoglycan biosynthesis transport protein ExoP
MTYGMYGSRAAVFGAPAARNGAGNGRATANDGLSPGQILRRIWARRHLLIRTTCLVFAAIAVFVFMLTPRYTATSQVLIESPPGPLVSTRDALPMLPPVVDREKLASEIQVLLSRALADKVIQDLHLDNRPEFNATLRPATFTSRVLGPVLGNKGVRAAVVQSYYDHLRVTQVPTSRVIAVEFSSEDPQLARDVSNKIVELYIDDQRRAQMDVNARTRQWLSEQIDMLRQRVAASEGKAQDFRARTGLIETGGIELQSQELTALIGQLSTARAARAEAVARVATLEQLVGADGAQEDGLDTALEVLQSPLIQQLRASEVQLRREITEMSGQLLPTHPNMMRKEAELADLDRQITGEIRRVIAGLRNQSRFMTAREASLQHDVDQLKSQRITAGRDQIGLRELEREAAADRTLLEAFLARFAEVSASGDVSIQDTDARVISDAQLPEVPTFPQKAPLLMLGLMIAAAAGLSGVGIAELSSRTVRYARDLEAAAGVPVAGILPNVPRWSEDEGVLPPGDAYGDAIRALHAALGIGPARNQRGKILLMTSTARNEGRTIMTVALARSMTQSGLKVLLVDADFEHPSMSQLLGTRSDAVGFSDLLAGRAGYQNVIAADPGSTAQFIPAGRDYAVSVLGSPGFQQVIDGLARTYDVVLIDCAPVGKSADAPMLARVADLCLYAVRWNSTATQSVIGGLRRIAVSGGRAGIGVVITRADSSAAI